MALYTPLPSHSSIRVLSVDASLNCQLSIVDLDDENHAPYNCLSYTWGSPLPPGSPDAARYEMDLAAGSQSTILVDGKELTVTRNLYEALQQLQKSDPMRLSCIWIDAICIDQRDPEGLVERERQVAMMDRIYANSEVVLVWLGQAAEDEAHLVISTLQDLARVSVNTLELALMDGALDVLDPHTYARLAIAPITLNTWQHLQLFFHRTWFQRAWTHQEAALGKKLCFHLGSHALHTGRELERAIMLIYRLGVLFSDLYSSPPGIVVSIRQPDVCLQVTEETCMVWNTIQSIMQFRRESKALGTEHRFASRDVKAYPSPMTATREYAGNPQAWKAFRTHILHKGRRKKASDPRDKIYAMLGLLQGMYV
jgi:hypothetical protein